MKYGQNLIFVYGTLLSGTGSRMHRWLAAHAEFIDRGTFQGRLFSLGNYPGLVASRRAANRVSGEVYRLRNAAKTLAQLDAYEEFDPARPSKSEYVRVLRKVRCASGGNLYCWIYLYNSHPGRKSLIASGDFLSVQGLAKGIQSMEDSTRGRWSATEAEETLI